jgi:thiol-disulfide isomerase/thioredoxin
MAHHHFYDMEIAMYKKVLALCLLFFLDGCDQDQQFKNPARAFVSTRLAQSFLMNVETPDDDKEELCDGSGFIIHGDGHKTECPGCKACQKNDPIIDNTIVATQDPEYYIYQIGAEWCAPCRLMKNTTWEDKDLRELMDSKKIKLVFINEEDAENRKYLSYYKITRYPTILLIKTNELDKIISKKIGFTNSKDIKKMIEGLGVQ